MNRRSFLKTLGLGTISLAIPGCISKTKEPLADKTLNAPNIVYILADDLGYGDLTCLHKDSKIPTPNLDKLAEQGMIFTDAHSPSAVCSPTRYGILTGRYCWRSPLKKWVLWVWDGPLIEPNRLTVGDLLKKHGYATACVGKWHLGWDWATTDGSRINDQLRLGQPSNKRHEFSKKIDFTKPIANGPTTRGFDYYFGDDVPNFPPYCFIENDRTIGIPNEQTPRGMHGAPGPMLKGWKLEDVMPKLTEKAVEFIKTQNSKTKNKPFFLYFPLTGPHTPIAPTDDFLGTSGAHRYGDFICEIDHLIGRVVKTVDDLGIRDNTLIIFTSDNGSPARDGTNYGGKIKSVLKYGHNPSNGFRGIKADVWEGGHRIPFIASWPKVIPSGSTSKQTICLTDFMATCTAILGEKLPNNVAEDSYNILPALQGKKLKKQIRPDVIHHSGNGMFAIRKGKWKFVDGVGAGGWSGGGDGLPGQLYDMAKDPAETKNLYHERGDIVKQLKKLLEKYKGMGYSRPI
ncbi:MAG: sulfatase family protein [Planctomycetota bacterium]